MGRNLIYLLTLLIISSCNFKQPDQEYRLRGNALGTTYSIIYHGQEYPNFQKKLDSILKIMNQSMSTYIETSDISKLNNGLSEYEVDIHFQENLKISQTLNKTTEGYFDPTVGAIVNAYGFGPGKKIENMTLFQLDSIMQYVGIEKIQILENGLLKKKNPNTFIDFNAVAKGYTIDLIGQLFSKKDYKNFMIELGGELVASGINPTKNKPWIVAVDDPLQTQVRTHLDTLVLTNQGMATSGNYRKFDVNEETGEITAHIINPKTGKSEVSNTLSVSILATTCALADGYATALMIMPLEIAIQVLEAQSDVEGYIVYAENDHVKTYITTGFQKAIDEATSVLAE